MSHICLAFESITPFINKQSLPQVLMGDDTTALDIEGYGMMNITIHGKHIWIMGYYVPKLGVKLLSVKQHIKYQGCYFLAKSNQAIMAFPSFILYPSTTDKIPEIFLTSSSSNLSDLRFNQQLAIECKQTQWNQHHHDINVYPKTMWPFLLSHQQVKFQQTMQIQMLVPFAQLSVQGTKVSIGLV
jgi:hypothetical protein